VNVGDLIKIKQARIGIPKGAVGLVVNKHRVSYDDKVSALYEVRLVQKGRLIRLYEHDAEVINESR